MRVQLAFALLAVPLGLAHCSVLTDAKISRQALVQHGRELPTNVVPLKLKSEHIVFTNATVMTAERAGTLRQAYIYIKAGRIAGVGRGELPRRLRNLSTLRRIDLKGRYVTPGLIDTHSHMGVYARPHARAHADGNEMTSPNTAGVRAIDGLWPQDPSFQRAVQGGVTTVQVIPGSANLIGGRGITIKLHPATTARAMVFPGAPQGLKMACGENPKRVYGRKGRMPFTRMGSHALRRRYLIKARRYGRQLRSYNAAIRAFNRGDRSTRPRPLRRNLATETLSAMLEGRILLHVHCYRADDMARFIELADEFNFKIRSFHHAVEAYKIRSLLAKRRIAVSTWVDWWGFKLEARDAIPTNLALVARAGGRAILHSDSAEDGQIMNQEAARAYHYGLRKGIRLSENDALRWITLNPAWALGIAKQTGSIRSGKMADLVVWSHHPFSVYARARLVFIDGVRVFDATRPRRTRSDFEAGSLETDRAKQ